MRSAILVLLALVACCHDYQLYIDAGTAQSDGGGSNYSDAPPTCNVEPYANPAGCPCNPDAGEQLCIGGLGACDFMSPSTCRPLCATSGPPCTVNQTEYHQTVHGMDQCLCLPRS